MGLSQEKHYQLTHLKIVPLMQPARDLNQRLECKDERMLEMSIDRLRKPWRV